MVDRLEFNKAWQHLCRRFSRENDAEEAAMYRDYIGQQLTTEEFLIAARKLWATREFFPRPVDFIEAAKGGTEEAAAADWQHCQQVMAGNVKALDRMTEAGRKTMLLMGGVDRLRMTPLDEVHFRRAEFLRLHPSAQEVHRLEQGERPRELGAGERKMLELRVPRLVRGSDA